MRQRVEWQRVGWQKWLCPRWSTIKRAMCPGVARLTGFCINFTKWSTWFSYTSPGGLLNITVVSEGLRIAFSLLMLYADLFGTTILRSCGPTLLMVKTFQAAEPTTATFISWISMKNAERSLMKGLRMMSIHRWIEACKMILAWIVVWLRVTWLAQEQQFTIWARSSGTSYTTVSAFRLFGLLNAPRTLGCSHRECHGRGSVMTIGVEME